MPFLFLERIEDMDLSIRRIEQVVFSIKSFYSASGTLEHTMTKATTKADNWVNELSGQWDRVEIVSMSTQCAPSSEDHEQYIITLAVKCRNLA